MARNRKAAIIGYTTHKDQAPWRDPAWDLFGLNDAYRQPEWQAILKDPVHDAAKRVVWFQIHHQDPDGSFRYGASDPQHLEVLKTFTCPIITWIPHPDLPQSEAYPEAEVMDLVRKGTPNGNPEAYFNNSISWMIAYAMVRGYKEIGIYGVDMALDAITNAEYAHQRPSCEYFIAAARFSGMTVHIPEESDLCKCIGLYGKDDTTAFRKKLVQRHQELTQREQQMREEIRIRSLHLANCEGARQNTEYIIRTWAPGDGVVEVRGPQDPVTLRRAEVAAGVVADLGTEIRTPLPPQTAAWDQRISAAALTPSDGDGKD